MSEITAADVARYGALLHEAAHGEGDPFCRPIVCRQFDRYAEVLLGALAADGRLPTDTKPEWGVRWPTETEGGMPLRDEVAARGVVTSHPGSKLVRRVAGPWNEVSES